MGGVISWLFGHGEVHENPVLAELERRAQEQQQAIDAAAAEQAKAEEARRMAEDAARQSDEQRAKFEEESRRQEEGRLRAEEARRRAEDEHQRADADRRAAEDQRKRAEDDARRAGEERAKAEAEARKAQAEQQKADTARQEADKRAADARTAREKAEKELRDGIQPIVIPTLAQFRETKLRLQYREGLFHFAIAGNSGSGKSSLINAFRGLRSKDSGAAAVGVVETTSVIARYPDSNPANPFVWYDVPGAGTLSIPDWQYFTDQGLYIFDCIIVLFDNRFTVTDVAILRNCAQFQIPTYIVRSKSKQHIQNVAEDMADEPDADDLERARELYVRETRASVARNLEAAKLPAQRVYLVDKESLVRVMKMKSKPDKPPRGLLDEMELLQDLFGEARRRRVVEAEVESQAAESVASQAIRGALGSIFRLS